MNSIHNSGANAQSHSQRASPNIRGSTKFVPRRNNAPMHGTPGENPSNIIKIHKNDNISGQSMMYGANVVPRQKDN